MTQSFHLKEGNIVNEKGKLAIQHAINILFSSRSTYLRIFRLYIRYIYLVDKMQIHMNDEKQVSRNKDQCIQT